MWVSVAQTLLVALLSGFSYVVGSIVTHNVHEEAYSLHIILSKMRYHLCVGCVAGLVGHVVCGRFFDIWTTLTASCVVYFSAGLCVSFVLKERMMETKKHDD